MELQLELAEEEMMRYTAKQVGAIIVMFVVGERIVHKNSVNAFAESWEIMSVSDNKIILSGPGAFESCKEINMSEQWDYVRLVLP